MSTALLEEEEEAGALGPAAMLRPDPASQARAEAVVLPRIDRIAGVAGESAPL